MRNAAATFDDDFGLDQPARKKAPRRTPAGKSASGTRKKKGKRRFGFNFDMQKVARYAAIGMSATVALGIMVNALVMQTSRHPAPLFGKSIALGQSAPVATPALKPAPAAANTTAPADPVAMPMPVAKPRPVPAADDAAPAAADPIGRLLQGGSLPAEKTEAKTVLGAQRALAKLGFALKPTGNFGPQTRKAIELFEKDRHLPVKGELSRRVIKILAAESGLKIER